MTFDESSFSVGIGGEYIFKQMIAFRAGYHYGDETKYIPSYASLGLGFNFFGFNLNGAYLIASKDSPMKNTLMVTLGWGF